MHVVITITTNKYCSSNDGKFCGVKINTFKKGLGFVSIGAGLGLGLFGLLALTGGISIYFNQNIMMYNNFIQGSISCLAGALFIGLGIISCKSAT